MSKDLPAWHVGQEVAIGTKICRVERVTPSGMPVVEGTTYARDGRQRGAAGGQFYAKVLVRPLTPELRERIAEAEAFAAQRRRWDRLLRALEAKMPTFGSTRVLINSGQLRRICDAIESEITEAAP